MNDERGDQLMRELAQALAVDPSPDFAARVRAATAEAPRRRWYPAGLVWAGAAVAAAVVMAVVARPGAPPVPVVQPSPAEVASRAPAAPVPPRVASTPEVAVASSAQPVPAARHARRTPAAPPVRVASAHHEPEVLVPDDQRRALDRLLANLASGRVDPTVLPTQTADPTVPIQVPSVTPPAPIVILPLLDTAGGHPPRSLRRATR